ncbi:protein of unassigned function [Methylobacterium oryzae CBMB20]|uniref:Protein of unassigned function n=1 Tax=Methylobacterium oryzae CBMB20 TaxID=693986 RepID=A0A089P173_9HYPH|nr:protein of unassigned function [Methylobacterium oryzae CBMB20]
MPVDARRHRSRTPCRARRPSGSRAQTGCAQAGSTAPAFYTGIPASLTLSLSTRDKSAPFRRTCRPLRQCFHPIDTRASRAARRRKAGSGRRVRSRHLVCPCAARSSAAAILLRGRGG